MEIDRGSAVTVQVAAEVEAAASADDPWGLASVDATVEVREQGRASPKNYVMFCNV